MIVHVEKTTYELPYIILPKVQVYSLTLKLNSCINTKINDFVDR